MDFPFCIIVLKGDAAHVIKSCCVMQSSVLKTLRLLVYPHLTLDGLVGASRILCCCTQMVITFPD